MTMELENSQLINADNNKIIGKTTNFIDEINQKVAGDIVMPHEYDEVGYNSIEQACSVDTGQTITPTVEILSKGITLSDSSIIADVNLYNFGTIYGIEANEESSKIFVTRQPVVYCTRFQILNPSLHKNFIDYLGDNLIDIPVDGKRTLKAVGKVRFTLKNFSEVKQVSFEKSKTIQKADGNTLSTIMDLYGKWLKANKKLLEVKLAFNNWEANDVKQPPRIDIDEFNNKTIYEQHSINPYKEKIDEINSRQIKRIEKLNSIVNSLSVVGDYMTTDEAINHEAASNSVVLNFIKNY